MSKAARRASRKARYRVIRYLNCSQAILGTVLEQAGIDGDDWFRAACPFEGGTVSMGSTCGVVTGGCLAIAAAYQDGSDPREVLLAEPLYQSLRDYTSWFEREFGSAICRERIGVNVREPSGAANYLFTGKVFSRCVSHIGRASVHLVEQVDGIREFAPAGKASSAPSLRAGLCASDVMLRVRQETGLGSPMLERLSAGFDGGVGLSGGICGALAGAMFSLGTVVGIDPGEGPMATAVPFLKGHYNMYVRERYGPEMWSVCGSLARSFIRVFGSLECADLTGRSFENAKDLREYVSSSPVCLSAKDWCARNAAALADEVNTLSIKERTT